VGSTGLDEIDDVGGLAVCVNGSVIVGGGVGATGSSCRSVWGPATVVAAGVGFGAEAGFAGAIAWGDVNHLSGQNERLARNAVCNAHLAIGSELAQEWCT
jgi:hypothetical protein